MAARPMMSGPSSEGALAQVRVPAPRSARAPLHPAPRQAVPLQPAPGPDQSDPSVQSGPSGRPDPVEQALLAARDLIAATVRLHRREPARPSLPGTVPADIVERLVRGAVHTVCAVVTDADQEEALLAALDRTATPGGERLTVKLLCPPRAPAADRARPVPPGGARLEIRVTDAALPYALLVDARAAYLRRGPTDPGAAGSVVEDPTTVHALELMFAGAWQRALAPEEYPRLGGRLCPESVRRILECLRTGHTDEVAAREMRVSLRTYRRYVAEIMRELGAGSRFQAGVRAVELGLLPGRR